MDEAVAIDPFAVRHITLMRSVLKPTGAEHIEVARVPLDAPREQ
jgi:2'-5' RNA ligase